MFFNPGYPLLRVPISRIVVCWESDRGTQITGNHHVEPMGWTSGLRVLNLGLRMESVQFWGFRRISQKGGEGGTSTKSNKETCWAKHKDMPNNLNQGRQH